MVAQVRSHMLKFLVRASYEPGFENGAQLSAPFVIYPGSSQKQEAILSLLKAWEQSTDARSPILIDRLMSEEGGRFYHDINRYLLIFAPSSFRLPDDDDMCWLTLSEITALKCTPGVFTNEFRSGLSMLVHYL